MIADSLLGVFVGGALEIERAQVNGIFAAVARDVVQLAVGDPVILDGETGAVLQKDHGVGRGRGVFGAGIIWAGIFGGRILPLAWRGLLRRAFVNIRSGDVKTWRRVVAAVISVSVAGSPKPAA